MNLISGVMYESISLLYRMAPYLLLGFLFAGILHAFISLEWIAKHLGRSTVGSVIKSVMLGIPLPLCSCAVIPAAMMLNRKGASRGSVVSFLISTPIISVASILATYSLMGLFFTAFRVFSSAITAIAAGVAVNFLLSKRRAVPAMEPDPEHGKGGAGPCCGGTARGEEPSSAAPFMLRRPGRFREMFRYAFVELLGDIWRWLVVGLIIGGLISYTVSDETVARYLGSPFLSMLVMLIVSIPMYVCSTGSLPIAAALMLKGMSPGAAMVFLLAGPATNAVTITVVAKQLGKGAASLYVLSIAVMSIAFGYVLNQIRQGAAISEHVVHHAGFSAPAQVEKGAAFILLALMVNVALRGMLNKGARRKA